MLESLKIEHLAVIEKVEIEFGSGLNVLSGETGAGKSIVLEAIGLILGARASIDSIREGQRQATVEGVFRFRNALKVTEKLKEIGLLDSSDGSDGNLGANRIADEQDGTLIIKRVISRGGPGESSGRNKIHVNGESITLSMLQKLADGLVELCGQHENQSLLRHHYQLQLVDEFTGKHSITRQRYLKHFDEYVASINERKKLLSGMASPDRLEYLKFQLKNLEDFGFEAGEEELLLQEKNDLVKRSQSAKSLDEISTLLDGEEDGVLQKLKRLSMLLKGTDLMERVDSGKTGAPDKYGKWVEFEAELEDLSLLVSRERESISGFEERLNEIQDRLASLSSIKRKFQVSTEEIPLKRKDIETEIEALEQSSGRLEAIALKLQELRLPLIEAAQAVHKERVRSAKEISRLVSNELGELQMEGARFQVALDFIEESSAGFETLWNRSGADRIDYFIETNLGSGLKSMGRIASGGELSRVTLAIRSILSEKDGIGVYLFDEVDTGLGGKTAFKVGKKLAEISKENQVIVITHLPQVAAYADQHFVVEKAPVKKSHGIPASVETKVVLLTDRTRKEELARMLGGEGLTKKALENAEDLLKQAKRK